MAILSLLDSPVYTLIFLLLLAIMAFLYASVGHGGASGYLAILALFSISPSEMKSSALMLNVVVSLIAFIQYYREGHFDWKLFFPFVITSIPMAYWGASITLQDDVYKKLLGICLLFPIIRLAGFKHQEHETTRPMPLLAGVATGAFIGLLSGMIGIGGGILLSPMILLFQWAGMKKTAAVSALFIFVNSISGLLALIQKDTSFNSALFVWLPIAATAGLTGAYFGSKKFDSKLLRYLLAVVLLIASVKLLLY